MNSETKKKTKILLVDDDRLILGTLASGLRAQGYEVFEAVSGNEAIKQAKSAKPDLALVDVRLPDLSGPEIAERLSQEDGIPVLFLSAYDDRESVEKATAVGGLGYLVNPFAINHLLPTLEIGLQRARELRTLKEREARLQKALVRNREINAAVGVLMERYRMPYREAYESLRSQARTQRCKVTTLAAQVIEFSDFVNSLVRDYWSKSQSG